MQRLCVRVGDGSKRIERTNQRARRRLVQSPCDTCCRGRLRVLPCLHKDDGIVGRDSCCGHVGRRSGAAWRSGVCRKFSSQRARSADQERQVCIQRGASQRKSQRQSRTWSASDGCKEYTLAPIRRLSRHHRKTFCAPPLTQTICDLSYQWLVFSNASPATKRIFATRQRADKRCDGRVVGRRTAHLRIDSRRFRRWKAISILMKIAFVCSLLLLRVLPACKQASKVCTGPPH